MRRRNREKKIRLIRIGWDEKRIEGGIGRGEGRGVLHRADKRRSQVEEGETLP